MVNETMKTSASTRAQLMATMNHHHKGGEV
jgi:hypothetical protein